MSYRRFELLLIALGFAVILATMIDTINTSLGYQNLLGQALMAPVLFVALHWGRRSGRFAALGGSLIYLAATATGKDTGYSLISQEIVIRAIAYGVVGILGGELAHKMKYVLAGIENEEHLDPETKVFDKSYLTRLIQNYISYHSRYTRPFSIIMITLTQGDADAPAPRHLNPKGMRLSAMILRDNIRIIDELGCWNEKSLCVVAPDTAMQDAPAACKRITSLLEEQLTGYGHNIGSTTHVSSYYLTFPGDRGKIEALLGAALPEQTPSLVDSNLAATVS